MAYPKTIVPLKAKQMATSGGCHDYDDCGNLLPDCMCLGAHVERLFGRSVFTFHGRSRNPMVRAIKEVTASVDPFFRYNRTASARAQASATRGSWCWRRRCWKSSRLSQRAKKNSMRAWTSSRMMSL